MKRLAIPLNFLMLAAGVAPVGAQDAKPAEADAFIWEHVTFIRVAFYEAAPGSMATSMKRAVRQDCTTPSPSTPAWLCAKDTLTYLRGVNVLGTKLPSGYICGSDAVGKLRFYPEDMIAGHELCRMVCHDSKSKQHFFQAQDPPARP